MRVINLDDRKIIFTPLEPHEMIRLALVEGMKPKYKSNIRQQHRRLVAEHTNISYSDISRLFRLYEVENPTPKQEALKESLVLCLNYKSEVWKPIDYELLERGREPVIIRHNGDIATLVELLEKIPENKVIATTNPVLEQSYNSIKNVNWKNKLVLNGPDVAIYFLQLNGYSIPHSLSKGRRFTEESLSKLEKAGFSFREALKTSIDYVLKDERYRYRRILLSTVKYRAGGELRLSHRDFIEGAELYGFILHKGLIVRPNWSETAMRRYAVPKRIPEKTRYNVVEIHYLPDSSLQPKNILDWFFAWYVCDCKYALNMRDMEFGKKRKKFVVPTLDAHGVVALLNNLWDNKIHPNNAPNAMCPLPTEDLVRYADKLRYNLIIDLKTKKRALEPHQEVLINEALKKHSWSFHRAYVSEKKLRTYVIRSMYFD
ncbi:MAG: hypothetical protein QXK37_00090 [Candidatus Woesearchaeota archaeon]